MKVSFTENMALSGIEGGQKAMRRKFVLVSTKSSPNLELGE
jgi:hypothetical protein